MHFGFINVIYYTVTSNIFWPLLWPSSGCSLQEYEYISSVSGSLYG